MTTPIVCWKCGYGHRSNEGHCLRCAADWFFPPRPADARDKRPYKVNPRTFASTINTRVPAFLDDC